MKTPIKNSELMLKYDITPFQLSQWRTEGLEQPKKGFSYLEDVLGRLSKKAPPRELPKRAFRVLYTQRASVSRAEAAEILNLTTSGIERLLRSGDLDGFNGRVFLDCIESYVNNKDGEMTIHEAAARWGVSVCMVRQWKKDGLLKGSKERIHRSEQRPEGGRV